MNDTTYPIQITDDNPTDDQMQQAFQKACHEFGDCVADYESAEFTKEFHDQLNRILNEAAIQNLLDKELVTTMVRDDGEIGYMPTQLGTEVAESSAVLV